jgi:hypothetical protein
VPAKKRLPIIEPWSSPASFHEVRRGRALEGQFVADVADDAHFQRVREVNARIAACDLRNLRYEYANSIARASASPPRTMSVTVTTPHSYAVRALSGRGYSRNVSARPAPGRWLHAVKTSVTQARCHPRNAGGRWMWPCRCQSADTVSTADGCHPPRSMC